MTPRILQKLQDRILGMIGKAILSTVDDTTDIQLVKISGLAEEVQDGVERVQNFGFTSNPPENSETIVLYLGGNRDHPVAIAIDNARTRKKNLKAGESAIYTAFDNFIHLREDGSILIEGSAVHIAGENGKALITEDMVSKFNSHTHPTPSGPSSAPTTPIVAVDVTTQKTKAE